MRIVTLVLLAFSFLTSLGQENNFIVREDGTWSTLETHCFPNGNNYSTYHIRFEEDTVIDEHTYQKIWRCDEESQINWEFYGFIRENEAHEVFLKPPDYFEGKIYDFSVEMGDSIQARNVYLNSDTLKFVVTSVDSIFLTDRYRKRIVLHEYINNQEEIWIEGLGSYYGILNSCNNAYGGVCGNYEALCYVEEEQLIYQHPDYNTCFYEFTVNVNERGENNNVKIYPNPAKKLVNVDLIGMLRNELPVEMKMFDPLGQTVISMQLTEMKTSIALEGVEKGLYFIQIKNLRNTSTTFKVIVD